MDFKKLHQEYKELVVKTHIEAQILRPGQPYCVNYISPDDLVKRKLLAKKLAIHGAEYFKDFPEDWFDIQRDARD